MPQHAEIIEITSHGATLSGRLFLPERPPKAAIVLHGATGVPQRYYRHFTTWLVAQGYACLTYDYRDFGASAKGHPRHSSATMADWGVQDQNAAQRAMEARFPDSPLWVIGHSLGGFMVPFQEGAGRIDRLITVASGAAYLGDHPWPYRAMAALFWYGPGALATKVFGYLPGKALRTGPDLPAGVYWQWRRWCTSRSFYQADVGSALPKFTTPPFAGPIKVIALSDDVMMPPKSVWKIMRYFPAATKQKKLLHPADFGLKKIGHIEVFSRKNAALWPEIIK